MSKDHGDTDQNDLLITLLLGFFERICINCKLLVSCNYCKKLNFYCFVYHFLFHYQSADHLLGREKPTLADGFHLQHVLILTFSFTLLSLFLKHMNPIYNSTDKTQPILCFIFFSYISSTCFDQHKSAFLQCMSLCLNAWLFTVISHYCSY